MQVVFKNIFSEMSSHVLIYSFKLSNIARSDRLNFCDIFCAQNIFDQNKTGYGIQRWRVMRNGRRGSDFYSPKNPIETKSLAYGIPKDVFYVIWC
jgi:hypothetical protein